MLLRWLGPSVSKKRGVCRSEATAKLGLAGSDPTGLFGNPQVKPPRMFRAGGFTWGLLSSGGVGPRQPIEAGPSGPHGTRLTSGTLRKEFARRLQGSTGFSAPGSAVFGLEWGCFWAVRPARARRAFGGKGRAAQRLDLRVRPVGGWPRQPIRAGPATTRGPGPHAVSGHGAWAPHHAKVALAPVS